MSSNPRLWRVAHEAMRSRGLLPDFSHEVVAAASALREPASDPAARDMRALPTASIDNDDSRDLDQLSVAAAPHGKDEDTIYVAISDVDALVHKGSDIDQHAATTRERSAEVL